MRITILGLSITSSWGNGHATNYRALARALHDRGDEVTFLEREQAWYAEHRDLADPPWCRTGLYGSVEELRSGWTEEIASADLVIVGSFVPDGPEVIEWVLSEAAGVRAFYDIDTPVTLGKLRGGDRQYLAPEQVERFDLYLSFTAGTVLEELGAEFGARRAEAFYCFVDPHAYQPLDIPKRWRLNYLGTYSPGRQPAVEELLLKPARCLPQESFAIAGPMYPPEINWPPNVEWTSHLPPPQHPRFYCTAGFTLNLTRPEMRAVGFSPSVRLFEAAACAVPVISDRWPGIETIFAPDEEILLAERSTDIVAILDRTDAAQARRIGLAARERVLKEHTAQCRVRQLHRLVREALEEPVR